MTTKRAEQEVMATHATGATPEESIDRACREALPMVATKLGYAPFDLRVNEPVKTTYEGVDTWHTLVVGWKLPNG